MFNRIGTLEIENAVTSHPAVAEAAAVGKTDPIKGEVIVIFAILREGFTPSPALKANLRENLRQSMGSVVTPDEIYFVDKLPKTRSGKIMRRLLRAVASDMPIGDITTLEDEASIEEVKKAYEELKIGL